MGEVSEFEKELAELINKHSMENPSNTPDFLLAGYLTGCMRVFAETMHSREFWYGRDKEWFVPEAEGAGK